MRDADKAAVPGAPSSQRLPCRVLPGFRFPADSLCPGTVPAHEARWAAVRKTVMSAPVSAMMTSALDKPIPGMVCSSSSCAAKGRIASSMRPDSSRMLAVIWSTLQMHPAQERVVFAEAAGQCFHQRGDLGMHPAFGEFCQHVHVRLAVDIPLDGAAGKHRRQLRLQRRAQLARSYRISPGGSFLSRRAGRGLCGRTARGARRRTRRPR